MNVLAILKGVGTEAEKLGTGAVHVVEVIGNGAVCFERLLTDASKLTPEVKAGLTTLIADGEAVATGFISAGSNPANFVADAAEAANLAKFVKDFVAFLPVIKAAAGTVKADLTPLA
ncbi:hypothetical protein [Granulicella tundricola]|uniref:Uncharacterized protein n=1 Tax=Granulicella tundricola (strain ATCC BAA-1859 / DSM 23138 / MP5ACTX9) TaxID=1198114 RepID=E8X0R8_GRATM|nr:hypothetical protein [Granulicella tundricola]ADW69019.1 hypothetical protein AciX9_1973 [Granulicella tundricola MP5ACTX9]